MHDRQVQRDSAGAGRGRPRAASRNNTATSEREAVVAHLSAAAAEGRLTVNEFSERARQAYASRTAGELARLVHDLPARPGTDARRIASASLTAKSSGSLPLLALIFGIVSLPAMFLLPLGAVAAPVAIVLGILSFRGDARGVRGGRDMAIAGLLCGLLAAAVQVAMVALILNID